jgi:hypothetical protein
MCGWLYEGWVPVYILLGGLALLSSLLYRRNRRTPWAVLAGIFLALLVGYFLLDRLVETGREQAHRKMREMAAAVAARKPEGIFQHISEQFEFHGMNKAAFRPYVVTAMERHWVDRLEVWDFEDQADWCSSRALLVFRAKPIGSALGENAGFRVESDFVRDADGQWRLAGFRIFDPLVNANQPLEVPGSIP